MLKIRWSLCFTTTLTRRRNFYGCVCFATYTPTNLTSLAYLIGRLDLTRFSIY